MVTAHGVTHRGKVRSVNEDSWVGEADLGFFVVADGMGGHNAGEVASQLAVEAIRGFLLLTNGGEAVTWPYGLDPKLSFDANRLLTSMKLANRRVFKVSESRDAYTGMGTTAVAALLHRDHVIYSSVGDSRLYSFVNNRLQQLTRDDSWIAELLAREPTLDKTDLANHPMRYVLTNVIGAGATLDVDVSERPLIPGELLLLCSDGLYGALGDGTIASILATRSSIVSMAERLLETALEGDARDNITAVLVQCD
jgi:serine/threonine protein phosphatase PrpC